MKRLTILFALFIGFIILLANTGNLDILYFTGSIPNIDKAGHFLLYGVLALLINLTLFRSYPHRDRIWMAVSSGTVLALLIGLEEWSQRLFVNRTFSIADLTASYLGVVFFAWVAVKIKP
ncbi:MAG: VanZ family protein [Chloroflexota bacterium]|nr:VanZ family protein [Chloroflexota bacterium]